ncbi:MAG TPA: NAD(P)-dependent oxidoreductase [Candidatus Dormibacteraeota bacterium]|nr:NAD(P)-dependent oxidoreductase [Candidatus Dormibacteraeota bacterium]
MPSADHHRREMSVSVPDRKLGWIGTGRMGYALASRLLQRGCDLTVYNRTRAKAEPLAKLGARIVDRPADLADRDIVVVSVADSPDFASVMTGSQGLLSNGGSVPRVVVDTSTVSMDVSKRVRDHAEQMGSALLAAPVSGNAKVAKAGKLTMAVSGPRAAYDLSLPYLQMLGASVVYVGEGESARLVKICHNLVLGVVTQIMAETTVLAERGGVSRADYLEFLNGSVMGSTFSRYKTPAFVNLDFTPTFTAHLLRKDFELGLAEARLRNVPMPVSALVHQIVVNLIGNGMGEQDFASLLELEARGANLRLEPDPRHIADGLSDKQ